MHASRFTRVAGALFLVLASACGETTTEEQPPEIEPAPTVPEIATFDATPEEIEAGATTTLQWVTRNVVSITITDEHGNPVPVDGVPADRGSVQVQPTSTTGYTLVATGLDPAAGQAWRSATVAVRPAPPVETNIEAFTASAAEVPPGGAVTLSWKTTGATSIAIEDDADVALDLGDADPAEGQITVHPARPSTVYHLTAVGPGGARDTARVTVGIAGYPRVRGFYVEPMAPVQVGGTVSVIWETSHADRVVIRQDGATLVDTTTEPVGRREVTLDDNALFSLEAIGTGGTSTATAMARVGATVHAFAASERVVRAGDPVEFTWALAHADRAVLDGPGGYHLAIPGDQLAAGSAVVDVSEGGDFVLQAFREEVVRTAAVAVDVTSAPRIRSLAVDPAAITADPEHPATVTLSWAQDGAERCTVYANTSVVPGFEDFPCGTTGTAEVSLTGSAALRLVAENADGSHALTAAVLAVPAAKIAVFAATPDRKLSPLDTVALTWEVTDAVSIALEKDGLLLPVDSTRFAGSTTDQVLADSFYVLTALNSLGFPTRAQLTVRAGAPDLLAAVAAPDFVAVGSAFELRWTADGGDELTVTGPGGELSRTTDPATIDEGSLDLLAPIVAGTYPYTITATNGGGTSSLEVELRVSDGPMIRGFTADPVEITLGQSVTLTWSVDDDAAGNTPSLTLVDDYENDWTGEVAVKDPNNGSVTIEPAEEGRHLYTLTATTGPDRMQATAVVPVEVTVKPFLHTLTATPDIVSTEGGTVVPEVTLAWTSENAVELTLWEADPDGNPIPPAFHRRSLAAGASQADLDAGTFVVRPTVTTTYLARSRNRVGADATKTVKVIVDPPEVLTFTATPDQVRDGGTLALSWTTRNATAVAMEPRPVRRPANTYVDISALPGATQVTLPDGNEVVQIDFPTGFTFPFEGEDRTAIQVSTEGWAGFNLTNTATNATAYAFPTSSTYNEVNFALYWCSLDQTYNTAPAGELWFGSGTDADGDFFAVQWKHWSWYTSTYRPSDLNFELVLRPNGDFEYRYGVMTAATPARAAGEGCGIGYQGTTADQPWGQLVPHQQPLDGGLAGTAFAVSATLPVNGSADVQPSETTTYQLIARNADSTVSRELTATVWKTPVIVSAGASPVAPEATGPFELYWAVEEATQVRVLDAVTGAVICLETDPAEILSGSCEHTEATPGPKNYVVEAANGPVGAFLATTTWPLTIQVVSRLRVDAFDVAPGEFAAPGDTLTLTWSSTGAAIMQLLACTPRNPNHCLDITPSGADPAAGSLTYTVNQSTEFWFRIYDVLGRLEDASRPVWVGAPTLDGFTASATQVSAGSAVTLTWSSTDADSVTLSPSVPMPPPTEVTATAPFIDISSTGVSVPMDGTEDGGRYLVNFPAGFAFPWFGQAQTGLIATTDGWITFNTGYASADYSNSALPDSTNANLAMAVLWDDGKAGTNTQLLYELRQSAEGRHLVIQWKGLGFYATPPDGDLNFEIVLWENGDFDYRYGSMSSSTAARTNGNSATIGYQSPDLTLSHQFSFNVEVTGGLAYRSWRYEPGLVVDGSLVVTPEDTTTYRLCATNASLYLACGEVTVVVVHPGDLLFTEAMIAPADPDAEWFELRNVAPATIDLAGWTISGGPGDLFTIPADTPLPIGPGEYRVFARSGDPAVNGGLVPDVVYGSAVTLDDTTDALTLTMGALTIDQVVWNTSWTIPATASIAIEPSKLNRNPAANDVATDWCPTTATYGTGTFAGSPGETGNGCLTTGALAWYLLDGGAGVPFIDISATGIHDTAIFDATYYTDPIPLGFTMPYFDDLVDKLQITKHGYVAFPTQTTYYSSNSSIPNATTMPNGFVAPFWDYLYDTDGVSALQHERRTIDGQRVMIVQWSDVSFGSTSYGSIDFQVQLRESGDIAMVYRDLRRTNTSYDYLYGSSATIGIESNDGTVAYQIHYGTASTGSAPIYDGRSYLFRRRPAPPAP